MRLLNCLILPLASITLLCTATFAADKAPALTQHYEAELIGGDIYVIHGPLASPTANNQGFMNNPAIIITTDGIVIIDPGSSVQSGEMVLAAAKKISNKPVIAAFATHIHGDHWLGNQAIRDAYPKAKFYAHTKMIEQANNGEADTWLELLLDLTNGATAGTQAVIPEITVTDGEKVKIGNKTFLIINKSKAHTETDIMIHVLEDDVYFLGDNSPNGRMGRLDDGSFVGLIETLNIAIETNAKHYVPGHGQSGDKSIVISYRDLMSGIYEGAKKYYDEGLDDFEMKPMIVESLQPWHNWSDFDEVIGRFISLAVLEAEEHAFD